MDNTNTNAPQSAVSPEPSLQSPNTVSSPTPAQNPQPLKKSGLKKLLIVVVAIIGAIILIGGVGFFALLVFFFHAVDSGCGPESSTHKTEVSKVAIFNTVSVLPGQPNEPASIYDSSGGTCNLDVAQSYSATKSYTVNMNGAAAVSTVTDSLSKQGFTLSKQGFAFSKQSFGDDNNQCPNIWGEANYTGKSITITVDIGTPTKPCPAPRAGPSTFISDPTITQAQFANATITSIKATVSTP